MITGKSSGSGTYSFHERSIRNMSVMVAKMPEEQFQIRIVFKDNGEPHLPVLKIDLQYAEMLWAALSAMSKDLGWLDMGQKNAG